MARGNHRKSIPLLPQLLFFLYFLPRKQSLFNSMDQLRKEAREVLQRDPWNLPDSLRAARAAAAQNDLHQLWLNVSTHDNSTHLNVSVFVEIKLVQL